MGGFSSKFHAGGVPLARFRVDHVADDVLEARDAEAGGDDTSLSTPGIRLLILRLFPSCNGVSSVLSCPSAARGVKSFTSVDGFVARTSVPSRADCLRRFV